LPRTPLTTAVSPAFDGIVSKLSFVIRQGVLCRDLLPSQIRCDFAPSDRGTKPTIGKHPHWPAVVFMSGWFSLVVIADFATACMASDVALSGTFLQSSSECWELAQLERLGVWGQNLSGGTSTGWARQRIMLLQYTNVIAPRSWCADIRACGSLKHLAVIGHLAHSETSLRECGVGERAECGRHFAQARDYPHLVFTRQHRNGLG